MKALSYARMYFWLYFVSYPLLNPPKATVQDIAMQLLAWVLPLAAFEFFSWRDRR